MHFSYSKRKDLFDKMNLQLTEGKIYGLLGKNGTGKSSLLKLIIGVLFPKQGKISIEQYDSIDRNPDLLQNIFFLSEDYEMPSIPITDYVKANAPLYDKFDHAKFDELLRIFEVDSSSVLSKLSYGQKKKVLISFGIATNAKYLFMDEPTNGLDIPSKSQFRKVLLSGFREDQIVIISTHQIRDLNQLIESVIIIEDGKIILNQDVSALEEKLTFHKALSETHTSDTLYSELMPGGYVHVTPNSDGSISEVELEVLFNAVIKDSNSINQLLQNN